MVWKRDTKKGGHIGVDGYSVETRETAWFNSRNRKDRVSVYNKDCWGEYRFDLSRNGESVGGGDYKRKSDAIKAAKSFMRRYPNGIPNRRWVDVRE